MPFYSDLPETIKSNEKPWRLWYENGAPEEIEIPNIEERLTQHKIGELCDFDLNFTYIVSLTMIHAVFVAK